MTYQQCTRCIMDNRSDKTINFDSAGCCNYCTYSLAVKERVYFPGPEGQHKLETLISKLKVENRNREYDCLMGISGGLDSSYLAYLGAVKWGLRILAVHVDDGFDTEISIRNIERIAGFPNLNLKIVRPDQKQYNELVKAYMRAQVPNLAVPQDNVLFANIYRFMRENKLRTFLSGSNFALESILQTGNTHTPYDLRNLNYIHRKFGHDRIDKLSLISAFRRDIDAYLLGIKTIVPLNYVDYNRDKAMKDLIDYCGFEYYGGKHLENYLTKFIQQYWFFHKFNVDKRTSHLSSMVISGQMTREEAQRQYDMPLYDEKDMQETIKRVLGQLTMNQSEFNEIMLEAGRQHTDYLTSLYLKFYPIMARVAKKIIRRT